MLGTLGLAAVAVSAICKMAGPIRQSLGDTGEALASQLLAEQPGWQELPFDQPKHGFDRLFTVPGLPLIVVESKVHRRGQFRLGQTQAGEQGLPAWIAAQAGRMADSGSAQWSPVNERIAALIQELGPENVPAVAVVIETETGRVSLYCRKPGQVEWQPLQEGMSLHEMLTPEASEEEE